MTVYEKLYYSNKIGALSRGGLGIGEGIRETPETMELYHKMIIVV